MRDGPRHRLPAGHDVQAHASFRERFMTMDPPRYWFPAKRYGWGWGLPTAWQGWGVIAGYASLVVVGIVLVPPGARTGLFLVYIVAITILLIGICRLQLRDRLRARVPRQPDGSIALTARAWAIRARVPLLPSASQRGA